MDFHVPKQRRLSSKGQKNIVPKYSCIHHRGNIISLYSSKPDEKKVLPTAGIYNREVILLSFHRAIVIGRMHMLFSSEFVRSR